MINFELIKDNTIERTPVNPMITYELIGNMGRNETKTIFSSDSIMECYKALDEIRINELDKLDLTKQEYKKLISISLNIVLTACDLTIYKTSSEVAAVAELQAYEIKQI